MTGTDVTYSTHKSVPVVFEPPCTLSFRVRMLFANETVCAVRGILCHLLCFLAHERGEVCHVWRQGRC
jgi:hypothetical protein